MKIKTKTKRRRSPVARHMNAFCKAMTMRDKKNDYQRTPKHRSSEFGVRLVCLGN